MLLYTSKKERELAQSLSKEFNNAKTDAIKARDISPYAATNAAKAGEYGLLSEIVFSRITGQQLGTAVYTTHGDNVDFGTIELKSSTYTGADVELKIPVREYNRKTPALYVLCRVAKDLKWVEFLGTINRSKFDSIKQKKSYGYFDNYVCGVADLDSFFDTVEVLHLY